MIFQRALAVVLVHLRAEGFILLHDVQNVAQHFVGNHIGFRTHRRRARIKIHARHLAEEISRSKLGNRIAVGEIDGSVNGNRAVVNFLGALVFLAPNQ